MPADRISVIFPKEKKISVLWSVLFTHLQIHFKLSLKANLQIEVKYYKKSEFNYLH